MQTTSSPTSSRRSSGRSRNGLIAWLTLATILVAAGFVGQATGDSDPNVFYRYDLALSSLLFYGLLIGLTFLVATAYGEPVDVLGLRSFPIKWAGIAIGFIVLVFLLAWGLEPILHAGEEQGYAPDVWRPEHARAFLVNGLVAATFVPFAEELFFRGLGTRVLAFLGGIVAVAGTAVIFAMAHGLLVALPVLVTFGVALGWVRMRSDSVWPSVVAHGVYNGAGVLALYADLTN